VGSSTSGAEHRFGPVDRRLVSLPADLALDRLPDVATRFLRLDERAAGGGEHAQVRQHLAH
jgi:hypothetical protein